MAKAGTDRKSVRAAARGTARGRPPAAADAGWLLLVYRVPPEPSRNRVSVWRELKRQGALFLQHCVCLLPDIAPCRRGVTAATRKISASGGSHFLFPVPSLAPARRRRIVAAFRQLSDKEYEEIIEECRTKFEVEVEFERGRSNFTYEEAEEIREDFEKIQRWFDRVLARDWFQSKRRRRALRELARCGRLLEAFEEDVYRRAGTDQPVPEPRRGRGTARKR